MHWIHNTYPLKRFCHALLNEVFHNDAAAYTWLRKNTRTGHIQTLNYNELINLLAKLEKKRTK